MSYKVSSLLKSNDKSKICSLLLKDLISFVNIDSVEKKCFSNKIITNDFNKLSALNELYSLAIYTVLKQEKCDIKILAVELK